MPNIVPNACTNNRLLSQILLVLASISFFFIFEYVFNEIDHYNYHDHHHMLLLGHDAFAISSTSSENNSSSVSLLVGLRGIISTLLLDMPQEITGHTNNISSIQKFILAGNWNLTYDNTTGKAKDFSADFLGITSDGRGAHTHQIYNFRPAATTSIMITKGNASSVLSFFGIVDIAINHHNVWKNVNTKVTIYNGKTIAIRPDDRAVNYHFGEGQPIYGLVKP